MANSSKYGRFFGRIASHFGKDTFGHDVKAFGDTTGNYFFWDASANTFSIVGTLALTGTFNSGNIALVDAETITFGTGLDVTMQWDATNFLISAAADDSIIEIGDSAATQKSFDVKWYGNGTNGADYVYFDASANLIYTTGIDVQFKDNDKIVLGTGSGATGDVQIYWDASDLVVIPTVSGGNIYFGGSANILDTRHYGDSYVYNNQADATGCQVIAKKSRGAGDTALEDNDVVYLLQSVGLNDNATPASKIIANMKVLMTDVTDGSEDGAVIFETMVAGAAAAEKLRLADVATFSQGINVGVNDTGYDVKLFGATAGSYMLWDQANDKLTINAGTADLGTSCEADAYTVGGVAGVDFSGAITSLTVVKGIVTAAS